MPKIEVVTSIAAPIERAFDLSRSIDLHTISMGKSNERAIGGVTSGLIGLNGFVTWEATHFGIKQQLTSKITAFKRPFHFRDEQLKGVFKFILHDHYFEMKDNAVLMKDIFSYQSPFGILGKLADKIILTRHLEKLITSRNNILKEYAETGKWKEILN